MAGEESAREEFSAFFKAATREERSPEGHDPYPFQTRLALGEELPELIDIPTGLGKTDAVVLAWLWRRRFAGPEKRAATPRRLVYCLPMRTLVEQTEKKAKMWLRNLGLLAETAGDDKPADTNGWGGWTDGAKVDKTRIAVTVLMGGEDKDDWDHYPERDAIIIGTQDMLLSRALNRGYGMSRYRWPVHFGLLNNDCLWVMDEVQLMGSGVSTSTQLQAWRKELLLPPNSDIGQKSVSCPIFGLTSSIWMSATLHKEWLKSVDFEKWIPGMLKLGLESEDIKMVDARYNARKTCSKATIPPTSGAKKQKELPKAGEDGYEEALAKFIEFKHNNKQRLTLVILNTVDRAIKVYEAIRKRVNDAEIKLIHSRFRPHERQAWNELLRNSKNLPENGRIIVSTQVVEAGVDISARVLITELAPWSSLIQRIGRANRYGEFNIEGGAEIYWLDVSDKATEPYDERELKMARKELSSIAEDASPKNFGEHRNRIEKEDPQKLRELLPFKPQFVPRDKDLFELFDTTPDLTGADIDVSRYIRDGRDHDVLVFWRDTEKPNIKPQVVVESREELCRVPFHKFREALKHLLRSGRIWRWDYLDGCWANLHQGEVERIYPGQVFLLERKCGGYNELIGWTGQSKDLPEWIGKNPLGKSQDKDGEASDPTSLTEWQEIAYHTNAVRNEIERLLAVLPGLDGYASDLSLAARLHDWGKSAEAFQRRINKNEYGKEGLLLAKAPDEAWLHWKKWERSVFRHELASALAILETVFRTCPAHSALAKPHEDIINSSGMKIIAPTEKEKLLEEGIAEEIAALSEMHLNLLMYLICAHHGKVRLSLRASPKDMEDIVFNGRVARGVRDGEVIPECDLAGPRVDNVHAPRLELCLDPMEIGLSPRYGPSWQERTITLLNTIGPFRLAYLETILRAADWRMSK